MGISTNDIEELLKNIEGDFARTLRTKFSFYKCQREVLMKVLKEILDTNRASPLYGIIQMPTGAGKTVVATAIIKALIERNIVKDKYIIFLAPRRVLREQAFETFSKLLKGHCIIYEMSSVNELEYYKRIDNNIELLKSIRGDAGIPSAKVLVLTAQLLDMIKNKRHQVLDSLSPYVLICDEAHTHYVGEKTSEVINKLKSKAKVVLGLTATPTTKSIELFGKLLYYMRSSDAAREGIITPILKVKAYETRVENLRLDSNQKEVCKRVSSEWDVAVIERAEKYAEYICNEIKSIKNELGRYPKAAVIAANTREADLIFDYLKKLMPKDFIFKAHYRVDESLKILEDFKGRNEGILITVRMIDIGFDDPNLEVLFIARPIGKPGSYIQVRGRVLRRSRDKNNMKEKLGYAVIIDFTGKAIGYEKDIDKLEKRMFKEGLDLDDLDEELLNPEFKVKKPEDIPQAHGKIEVSEKGVFLRLPFKITLKGRISRRTREYRENPLFCKVYIEFRKALEEGQTKTIEVQGQKLTFNLEIGKTNRDEKILYVRVCNQKQCYPLKLGKIKGRNEIKVKKDEVIKKLINILEKNFNIRFWGRNT